VKKNILITGGSGLIGRRLTAMLLEAGHNVVHLSRSNGQRITRTFFWDVDKGTIEKQALDETDVIIHLAGAGIGDARWTEKRKEEIIKSRVASAQLLYKTIKNNQSRPLVFISASGIAYYGLKDRERPYTEDDGQGSGYLAEVVKVWEQAADEFSALGLRVVKIRTGLALSQQGGALKQMMRPIKFYVGAPLGTGSQPMSWIHLDDLCRIYCRAVEYDTMQGVYNAVAPAVVSNKTFTLALAKAMERPVLLPPVPAFVLKILLGEMADLVVTGVTVRPQRMLETEFRFRYQTLDSALTSIFSK
jgi:uncharacterized protein (TIGR01777 family)